MVYGFFKLLFLIRSSESKLYFIAIDQIESPGWTIYDSSEEGKKFL